MQRARRPRRPSASEEIQFKLLLPRELHQRLVDASTGGSISEEIRRRLEASFVESSAGSEDPRFADLLTAISHAAAAAARLQPLPPGIREREEDGRREPYDVARWGPDVTPYLAFREAVETLMNAFQPDGIPAASKATVIRLADQLVGLALGALGERGLAAFANLSEVDKRSMKLSGGAAQAVAAEAEERDKAE